MNSTPDRLEALARRVEDYLAPRDIKLLRDAAAEIRSLEKRLTAWVRRAAAEASGRQDGDA